MLPPTYSLSLSNGVPVGLASAPAASNYLSLTTYSYDDEAGHLAIVDQYHTIPTTLPGTLSDNFHRTAFVFDAEGYRAATIRTVEGAAN